MPHYITVCFYLSLFAQLFCRATCAPAEHCTCLSLVSMGLQWLYKVYYDVPWLNLQSKEITIFMRDSNAGEL